MPIRTPNAVRAAVRFFVAAGLVATSCFFPHAAWAEDATLAKGEALGRNQRWLWTQVTDTAAWNPCDGAGALVFKDRMWLLGGWNPGIYPLKCHNEVWNSKEGAAWTLVKANTFKNADFDASRDWEGRHTAGYVVYQDKMWVMEGYDGRGNRKDVWYSADGSNWNELPDTPWNPRHAASLFVFDNALWMVAGNNFEKDVWKLIRTPAE